jgi:large subunit ribosomal protein L30
MAEKMLKIELHKSLIGRSTKQIGTANSLGLKKPGDVTVQPDNAATQGKISQIAFMLKVSEAAKAPAKKAAPKAEKAAKAPAKKAAPKAEKAPAKKAASDEKKPAAKKAPAKKAASAEKKPAAKKTTKKEAQE